MQSMKLIFVSALVFCAFFSSCNVFTLTGAETDVAPDFVSGGNTYNTYYTDIPPIVTGTSSSTIYTGSNPNCGAGVTVTIYGAKFTNDTIVELYNISESSTHTPTSTIFVDETQIDIVLPSNLSSASGPFSIKIENSIGPSRAFAFNLGCA